MAVDLPVSIVYALPDQSWQVSLRVPHGTTLLQAITLSGFFRQFPQAGGQVPALGVYGQLCPPDRLVVSGDRIEIYRPLRFDPMASRRRRATHRLRTQSVRGTPVT